MTVQLSPTPQRLRPQLLITRLTIGICVFLLYRFIVSYLMSHISFVTLMKYQITIIYGVSAAFLFAAFIIFRALKLIPSPIRGSTTKRHWITGIIAVAVCYGLTYAITIYLGYGREPVMKNLGSGMNSNQYWLLVASIVVLPPIVEELAFRHFLMSALPIEAAKWIGWCAVGLTAFWFWHAHSSYVYWPTRALMLAMGLVLGWARLVTGGLLLPVALHSLAEVFAMAGDAIWVLAMMPS